MEAGLPVDKMIAIILLWMAPTAPAPQRALEKVPSIRSDNALWRTSEVPASRKVLERLSEELQASRVLSQSA